MKRCAVHFLIPLVVNICHFEQGVEIRVWCGGDHPTLMHEGGTNNPFMVAGGVGLWSKPCSAILIDITSLSVIVLELLYPHNKTARSFFSCFICETKLLSQHGSVGRYLPSRLLLMAFKVVTCKVLTFIMIIFEGRHGAKVCWYQEATSLWIIVLRPRWKIVLCGSVSPRDKSTSHFSHLGLSKLLSVGLFAPPLRTVYPFSSDSLVTWKSFLQVLCYNSQFLSFLNQRSLLIPDYKCRPQLLLFKSLS